MNRGNFGLTGGSATGPPAVEAWLLAGPVADRACPTSDGAILEVVRDGTPDVGGCMLMNGAMGVCPRG
jgi:hypothetical protein